MLLGLEPPEEFELDDDGLAKLRKRLEEAVDSGELGPDESTKPAPQILMPRAIWQGPVED